MSRLNLSFLLLVPLGNWVQDHRPKSCSALNNVFFCLLHFSHTQQKKVHMIYGFVQSCIITPQFQTERTTALSLHFLFLSLPDPKQQLNRVKRAIPIWTQMMLQKKKNETIYEFSHFILTHCPEGCTILLLAVFSFFNLDFFSIMVKKGVSCRTSIMQPISTDPHFLRWG